MNSTDTIIKKYKKDGFICIDKKVGKKLVSRHLYGGPLLMFKYPVTKENAGKGSLRLASGNDFIRYGEMDTLIIHYPGLPMMNKSYYSQGGTMSRLSDSSYLLRPTSKPGGLLRFVLSALHNHGDIVDEGRVLIDSVVIPIR